MIIPHYDPMIQYWNLDQKITFLNHGSFGATPKPILEIQDVFKNRLAQEPVRFFVREFEPLWWENKNVLANFIHTQSSNLTFVKNATQGVNTILNSISLPEGSHVLTTNHAYGACIKALHHFSTKNKWQVNIASIPFPIQNEDEVVESILKALTPNTKLLMIDHITSATGIIFPIKKISKALENKNIQILVDGAHVPGMLDLHIDDLNIDYYTGNLHKWCFVPNGSAFLWVKEEHQKNIFPLQISHYYDKPLSYEKDRWSSQFFWLGTEDNTQWICLKDAMGFVDNQLGGWEKMRSSNHTKLLKGREILTTRLNLEPPAPSDMLGFLFMLPTNIKLTEKPLHTFNFFSPIQQILFEKYQIEMPVYPFQCDGEIKWCIRISAQQYNDISQYEYLCECLSEIFNNFNK